MTDADVVIVGAGPAGLLAASLLGRSHRVVLVERGSLGWTSKFWVTTSRRLAEHNLLDCAVSQHSRIVVGSFLGGVAHGIGDLVVVDESLLLARLLERAAELGVEHHSGQELINLRWETDAIVVQTSGMRIRARCLVDAMGSSSSIAKTFRMNSFDGFYAVYGSHLRNVVVRRQEIILAFVNELGDPPPVFEVIPTGIDSALCAVFVYSKDLIPPATLKGAFYRQCKLNPFFETTAETTYSASKIGAIPIGRRIGRKLPGVFPIGEAAMIQPPLLGTTFNEILEYAARECDYVSRTLTESAGVPQFDFSYPIAKRFQDLIQLKLAHYLLDRNVEAFDLLVRSFAHLPPETVFNLCSNELGLRDMIGLAWNLLPKLRRQRVASVTTQSDYSGD